MSIVDTPTGSVGPAHSTFPATRRRFARPLRRLMATFDRPLLRLQQRWEYRLRLREMPDYLLRDMGLEINDAREESRKPFWLP